MKPDILHLRSRLPAWIGYHAWKGLPKSSRPHLVTTVHGPYTVGRYSSVMVRGERVIAVSEMIRGYILENYRDVDADRIRIIYRGVDPEIYKYGYQPDQAWLERWNAQYPQMKGKTLLTLPARLTRWKGQEDFIQLIHKLITSGKNVHGVIVGDAHPRKKEYQNELQEKIEVLGLQDAITMTGHRSDMKEILAISTIVYSLAHEPEAFGRTTIEALSMGVPVIGYAHGGVREQLQQVCPEGQVEPLDTEAVTRLTGQWLVNKPEVKQAHLFTLIQMCDSTFSAYSELACEA
ncbi:glycosyltransferase [Solemya elarraichensis gill symbiont]|uniref:glycosyltransferase n=1 Tax=Solemya elarraichensis gill symbiont TaxID=1918949 RepID=UPI0009985553|nr:glycosyltransferase [Solemya elarraichensis gill symbiont]